MKRCPTCSRVYDDASLRFCLDDGTVLVNKPAEGVPPETAVLPAPLPLQATIPAGPPPVADPPRPAVTVAATTVRKKLNPWVIGIGVLVLIVCGGLLAVKFWPQPALKWHLRLAVDPAPNADQRAVVNQAVTIIKNRLNATGVTRYQIETLGNQILLDLPAEGHPERIKFLVSTGGRLELVHMISPPSPEPAQTYETQNDAIASLNSSGNIPPNRRVLPYHDRNDVPAPKWVVIEIPAIVSGADIRDAAAVKGAIGSNYDITFSLNAEGAKAFGSWTSANINQYLAVVLNDEVKSFAFINSPIADRGQISGDFSKETAEDLALVLKSGALPAPIRLVEEHVDQ